MSVYVGIDWSTKKHDIVFLNEAGAIIACLTIPHQVAGFAQLERTREQLGVTAAACLVGLETAHNILVDFLWGHGYEQVYVIPPTVVKGSRGRYGSSGARSDQRDAQLLADILRTDRAQLPRWQPDSFLTRQIRAKVSLIHYLTKQVVRTTLRLRSVLMRYYPAGLALFGGLTRQITLAFLLEYSRPETAAGLSYEDFAAFMAGRGYPYRQWPKQFARLQRPQPIASAETVEVFAAETVLLARQLLELVRTNNGQKRALTQLFNQHPDRAVFASLHGTGDLLAPALLAKFGDDRQRFPQASSVQALAGTCPVTDASGKRRWVKFRRACDKEFRHIAQQWARSSLRKSVFAQAYWAQLRPRVGNDSDAYRRLANRWLAIAWKLWQTRQPYNEAYHLQQRAQRSQPRLK